MTITCQEMHDALVACIELRWKPIVAGKSINEVPQCQLCKAVRRHIKGMGHLSNCLNCPLKLTNGIGCERGSAYEEYYWTFGYNKQKAAKQVLSELIAAKNHFFPEGWDK